MKALEWVEATMARLFCGEADKVIWGLERMKPRDTPSRQAIDRCCSYLKKHLHRIDYGSHRKGGYPIGGGGIESAHRFICDARLKRSGAWWYVENSNRILALRCADYNGTFERVFHEYVQEDQVSIVIQRKKCMFEIYFSLLALYHIERSDTRECETSQAIA